MIRALRSPAGCPWDRQQTRADMAKYLMDEVCEVIDAIDSGSVSSLKEELGDLLFQILFLTVMAEEQGEFMLSDVMAAVGEKMVRRHPHVFGDLMVRDVEHVKANWQAIKRDIERKHASGGILDGIPRSTSALIRAQKMTETAATVGFDWERTDGVMLKLEEELRELRAAMRDGGQQKIREELGDVLFTLVNLSRFLKVSADEALRHANRKFAERFACMEQKLAAAGKTPLQASLAEMDALWDECKKEE
ncbi:MAG: nucleoside triphosphate pyrophosphohydrolase [Syntrophus sp. (in: bacteria)]|nr:nucleoside triphosphate pyrophosphohydrolase [Syntrophus sp. (in: bacteria)]